MHNNTTYKAFMAETAAKVAAEISKQFVTNSDMSKLNDSNTQYDIVFASIEIAEKLAEKLEEWWKCNGGSLTVFFDPEALHSGIESRLYDIAEKLDTMTTQMRKE